VGYLTTATFLSMAYRFTFPALIGLAMSLSFIGQKQLALARPLRRAL
jgi:hypothetical protein